MIGIINVYTSPLSSAKIMLWWSKVYNPFGVKEMEVIECLKNSSLEMQRS